MTTNRRLTEEHPESLGASLLRAARRDRAPEDIGARASSLVDAAIGSVLPAATHPPPALAPAGAPVAAKLAAWPWIAMLGVGVGVLGVSAATTMTPSAPTSSVAPASAALPRPATPAVIAPSASAAPVASAAPLAPHPATSTTGLASVRPRATGTTSVAAARPAVALASAPAGSAPAIASDSLAAEVAALDAARRALVAGDAVSALALLDVHDRMFTTKSLGPEAQALRIQALSRSGDRAAAVAAYRAFALRNPKSPVRAALAKELGLEGE